MRTRPTYRAVLAFAIALTGFSISSHIAVGIQSPSLDGCCPALYPPISTLRAQPANIPVGCLQTTLKLEKVGLDHKDQVFFGAKSKSIHLSDTKIISDGKRQPRIFVFRSKGFLFPYPLSLPPPSY